MTTKKLETISGKPATLTVAFRLTLLDYQKLQRRAVSEGRTMAALVQEWVIERLTERTEKDGR